MNKTNSTAQNAASTAAVYLLAAVDQIDNAFGQDYAKKNPALVAAFITACAATAGTEEK